MHKLCVALLCSLPLSGCVGLITAVTDRPITSDHLELERVGEKLKTISGDRRLVRVNKWSPNAVTICAETQADAISAHSGKDSLTIEARGGYSNEAGETLTGTYARTELSDIVRQMSWQNCNAYMNRTFDDNVFINQMVNLQSGAIDVLMARALHPAGAPDPNKGSTGTVPDATTCKADKTLVGKECKKKVPQAGH